MTPSPALSFMSRDFLSFLLEHKSSEIRENSIRAFSDSWKKCHSTRLHEYDDDDFIDQFVQDVLNAELVIDALVKSKKVAEFADFVILFIKTVVIFSSLGNDLSDYDNLGMVLQKALLALGRMNSGHINRLLSIESVGNIVECVGFGKIFPTVRYASLKILGNVHHASIALFALRIQGEMQLDVDKDPDPSSVMNYYEVMDRMEPRGIMRAIAHINDDNPLWHEAALKRLGTLNQAELEPHAISVAYALRYRQKKWYLAKRAKDVGFSFNEFDVVNPDKLNKLHMKAVEIANKLNPENVINLTKIDDENLRDSALQLIDAMVSDDMFACLKSCRDNTVRVRILSSLRKMDADTIERHIDSVIEILNYRDSNAAVDDVKVRAMETLAMLEPRVLLKHVDSVLKHLMTGKRILRVAALDTLGKLEPAALAQHAPAVLKHFEDSHSASRKSAVQTLGKLEPATLAQHVSAVLARLEDSDWNVRQAAVQTLGKLEPATLAQHAPVVLAKLKDPYWSVREAALETLGKLEPAALAQHAPAVIAKLGNSDEAWKTLGKLEPATLAQHVSAVLARLEDSEKYVRSAALETLGKLEPATLAKYADTVVAKLEDADSDVRSAALETLGKLAPATLAQHADAVAATLEGADAHVCTRAKIILGKLPMMSGANTPSAVRARLRWLRFRALFRAHRLTQRWLAHTYEPGRPGYYRNLEEFGNLAKRQKVERKCEVPPPPSPSSTHPTR